MDYEEEVFIMAETLGASKAAVAEMRRKVMGKHGLETYGRLNPDSDDRDFRKEAGEEAIDLCFYLLVEMLWRQETRVDLVIDAIHLMNRVLKK